MPKPATTDYQEYFSRYIDQVQDNDVRLAFENQLPKLEDFLETIDEERSAFYYAPGKWTIKEILQHLIDAERIFNYRALCIARKETASLPSFDENLYAQNSNANKRSWIDLKNEYINVRRSTHDLYKSFSDETLLQTGMANNNTISILSLGFITIGHTYHHINIVRERYLYI